MKCNYVTGSQYFPCSPFEPSFTGHKFPKKIVINSFLHNIKMKSSLVREHTFWTEASLLAKTNGKPDCDLFVGIFQRVVLATCICSELLDWLFDWPFQHIDCRSHQTTAGQIESNDHNPFKWSASNFEGEALAAVAPKIGTIAAIIKDFRLNGLKNRNCFRKIIITIISLSFSYIKAPRSACLHEAHSDSQLL